jgi:adenosylcobinamide kinase/adenosylcobinamide-phosphate guanylyltransferase
MGVVPMDAWERIWRERVGRTCGKLASQATRVVRMVCGIPTIIKDGDIA